MLAPVRTQMSDPEDSVYVDREVCCKKDCESAAVVVMKVYTEARPMFMSFCLAHILTGSQVLEDIAQKLISGEMRT